MKPMKANNIAVSPASIASIVRDGMLFDPKNWQTLMSTPNLNDILTTIDRLFATLNEQQTPYVLVGGVAMLGYIQGRNTQDVDLIMARSDGAAVGLLIGSENQDFAHADYEGLKVGSWLSQNKLFKLIQKSYTNPIKFGEHSVITATPEGLVILKLYALPSLYRQGQFDRAALYETDILQLAFNYKLTFELLLKVVRPNLIESDMEELGEIVGDIQRRILRMERN
jgi:hypothetical protein